MIKDDINDQEKRLSKSSERRHRWSTGAESIASSWWLDNYDGDDDNKHDHSDKYKIPNPGWIDGNKMVILIWIPNPRSFALSLHSLWTLPIVILQVWRSLTISSDHQNSLWWGPGLKRIFFFFFENWQNQSWRCPWPSGPPIAWSTQSLLIIQSNCQWRHPSRLNSF